MPTTDQQASQEEAYPDSRPVRWQEDTVPKNPPVSYYRARYYNQSIGRFIGEDPTGLTGGLNFYTYADNDPGDFDDPFGLNKYKCDLLGNCIHLPSGHELPPIPNSSGSILVDRALKSYRDCVSEGIKGIQDPTSIPQDPIRDMGKAFGNTMKPKTMPGDPGGVLALPNPRPNPLGADDGLAIVTELIRQHNCSKRTAVADACSDKYPLARLSRQF